MGYCSEGERAGVEALVVGAAPGAGGAGWEAGGWSAEGEG